MNSQMIDHEIANGVQYRTLYEYGTEIHVLICDPKKVQFIVTDHFNTVPNAVVEYGAFAGVNGDGWTLPGVQLIPYKTARKAAYKLFARLVEATGGTLPNSIAWSQGRAINTNRREQEPFLNVTKEGVPEIAWRTTGIDFFNTVSGDRYLVQDGAINSALYSRLPEKNTRTAVGITFDGHVVLMKCEGWDINNVTGAPPKGLDWIELANVGILLGCKDFINLDGGGSSTMVAAEEELGQANDDGRIGYRSTVNHLLVMADGDTPPPPSGGEEEMPEETNEYEVILGVNTRPQPSFWSASVGRAEPGRFPSLETRTVVEDIPRGGQEYSVTWVKLPDGNWAPMNHYSKEEVYIISVDNGSPGEDPSEDPPTQEEPVWTIELLPDNTLKIYGDGEVFINDQPYTP